MNFVGITGGLGSEMFQYTFSKYLEKKSGQTSALYINFYEYVKDDPVLSKRKFELDLFNTHFISVKGTVNYRNLIYEPSFDEEADIILDFYKGYWQDKRYYESVSDIIQRDFSLKEKNISDRVKEKAEDIKNHESISLHIRRSDYLNPDNSSTFCSLSPLYYEKALDILTGECDREAKLYVFSDDPDFISGNFLFLRNYDHEIMPVGEAFEDMYLMSTSRHHIIANSTFSWWGAVLSGDTTGITVAPKAWYKDQPSPNLYFDSWIII